MHQTTSNHIRQKQPPRTGADGHRSNMVQQRQRKERRAEGQRKVQQRQRLWRLREQLPYNNYKEAKASSTINNRLDKEIHSKDNKDTAKEKETNDKAKDTATNDKAKDTTNKQEKERKFHTQHMFATDAGWRSTTATLA